jgi:EC042_2821-lke REase
VVGVAGEQKEGLLLVSKKVDPNKSHPHLRKVILTQVGTELRGLKFNSYVFDAIVWRNKIKEQDTFCWKNENSGTFQYSQQLITHLKNMTKEQIEESLEAYKARPNK